MTIVVAGASGLIGTALVAHLRQAGHDVRRLVRRAVAAPGEFAWDPEAGTLDVRALAGAQAIINLAGENVAGGRWTPARRERIMRSRTDATRTIVAALGGIATRPEVLINASAVGFYGERGDDVMTEASPMGRGFLPEVVWAWETHADSAAGLGVRVVKLRLGVVLARGGGALEKMLPAFRLGVGGKLGSGRQWMSWVALEDVLGAIDHALSNPGLSGPVNLVAPHAVTNAEFTRELGRVLRRPVVLPVPALALRVLFGRGLADEALLGSTRVRPEALLRTGYRFRFPELAGALRAVV